MMLYRLPTLALILTIAVQTQSLTAPSRPKEVPQPHVPVWGAEVARGAGLAVAPLGVGHLRPADGEPNAGHEWVQTTLLPLYRAPGGAHWGWLAHGWLLALDGSKQPLPADCLVETSYEASSITLRELRNDGWFRLAIRSPCNRGEAPSWSHRSLLDFGEHKLSAESWEEFFFRDDISPLWFRQREIPHALRSAPAGDAERVAWIGRNHSITPLAVEGDWMRVRVFQPPNYCVFEEEWKGRELEGWVKWRDNEKGPWLYLWSRGC